MPLLQVLNKSDRSTKLFGSMTLGQYLKRGRYSNIFCAKYLLPMCAAIWSVSTATVLDFPVKVLVSVSGSDAPKRQAADSKQSSTNGCLD